MTENHAHDILENAGWEALIGRFPPAVDVADLARERRAFVRTRGVADAEVLLRPAPCCRERLTSQPPSRPRAAWWPQMPGC